IVTIMHKIDMEPEKPPPGEDIKAVEHAIHNVLGWAMNKDFTLFFNTISDDSYFISVTPYERVKFGLQDVYNDTAFWGSPYFRAIHHELFDLRIDFSADRTVAWFWCLVDDINTWKGEPANWEKVRWTGVLEKRNERWRVVQQHFSWPINQEGDSNKYNDVMN
ncbi:MAG: nuclear transport factor 2 family protein, partial [Bacteroidales bacterium]|nr:nuclear transport factor 2 family protein [Bacteroidales bacterium]